MKKPMLLFLLSIATHCYVLAQVKVTGQVTDNQNNAISLAAIDVIGTNVTTTTDDTGVFFMTLPSSVKKGDIIRLRIVKTGYKVANKQIGVSILSIPIRLIRLPRAKFSSKHRTKAVNSDTQQTAQLPPSVSVVSNNQSGGITANQVQIESIRRTLNVNFSNQLLTALPNRSEKIAIVSTFGDSESFQFATEISDFLKRYGYTKVAEIIQGVRTRPLIGQFIDRDTAGVKITIGSKQ